MITLSPEQEATLVRDFEQLKKTAKSTKDIATWFKSHPELIPGLPLELHKRVDVYASDDNGEETTDYPNKTIHVDLRFEFSVDHTSEKAAKDTITRITGLKLGRNQNTNPFFQSFYDCKLNALEWPFVAAGILSALDEEELGNKRKRLVYKNILEHNFPHHTWEAFYSLWSAGLLPEKPSQIIALLNQQSTVVAQLTVPQDMAL